MKKNIHFVSQYFAPETGATAELISRIGLELAADGFEVEATAGQPTYHGAAKLPKVMYISGVRISRVPSTQMDRNTVIGRVMNSVTFAAACFTRCLTIPRDHMVICLTNPPILPWIAWACGLLRKTPYIIVVHDMYPEIAVRVGVFKERSWMTGLWHRLNRISFRRAVRIVVLGRDAQDALLRKLPADAKDRVVIIPNWADGSAVIPMPKEQNPLVESLGLKDRFIVQYSGNFGRFHAIETILDCAAILQEEPFEFLFIGSGARESLLRGHMQYSGTFNVHLLPYQPRACLNVSLTACDVGLVTLREGMTGLAVPSKLYGILAAGKPVVVVGPHDCEPAMVVREHNCGLVVPPDDPKSLAHALRLLKEEGSLRQSMAISARDAFERLYDLPVVVDQWRRLLLDTMHNGNNKPDPAT